MWHAVFLSTLSLRRATEQAITAEQTARISIHALLAESDKYQFCDLGTIGISIHALLAESDIWLDRWRTKEDHFYPRSPCGERPGSKIHHPGEILFLSTLSLRRATREQNSPPRRDTISIHALLAESDIHHRTRRQSPSHFYPRSPCGERLSPDTSSTQCKLFLSTLSLRRATVGQKRFLQKLAISIHALLAESDQQT